MTKMSLILWLLPVLGITLIVTCSTIFRPMREWFQKYGQNHWNEKRKTYYVGDPLLAYIGELLSCPMCFGFWVGFVYSIYIPLNLHPYLGCFSDACTASYVSWVSHVALCALGQGRLLSSRPDLKGK